MVMGCLVKNKRVNDSNIEIYNGRSIKYSNNIEKNVLFLFFYEILNYRLMCFIFYKVKQLIKLFL